MEEKAKPQTLFMVQLPINEIHSDIKQQETDPLTLIEPLD